MNKKNNFEKIEQQTQETKLIAYQILFWLIISVVIILMIVTATVQLSHKAKGEIVYQEEIPISQLPNQVDLDKNGTFYITTDPFKYDENKQISVEYDISKSKQIFSHFNKKFKADFKTNGGITLLQLFNPNLLLNRLFAINKYFYYYNKYNKFYKGKVISNGKTVLLQVINKKKYKKQT